MRAGRRSDIAVPSHITASCFSTNSPNSTDLRSTPHKMGTLAVMDDLEGAWDEVHAANARSPLVRRQTGLRAPSRGPVVDVRLRPSGTAEGRPSLERVDGDCTYRGRTTLTERGPCDDEVRRISKRGQCA